MLHNDIVEPLANIQKDLGIHQDEYSAILGISQPQWSLLIGGKRKTTLWLLERICEQLEGKDDEITRRIIEVLQNFFLANFAIAMPKQSTEQNTKVLSKL